MKDCEAFEVSMMKERNGWRVSLVVGDRKKRQLIWRDR
jgi:hypothetical protein